LEEKRKLSKIRSIRPVDVAEYIYKKIRDMEDEETKADEIVMKIKELLAEMIVEMKEYTFYKVEKLLKLN